MADLLDLEGKKRKQSSVYRKIFFTVGIKHMHFGIACYTELKGSPYVVLLINPDKKSMIIKPAKEYMRNALCWFYYTHRGIIRSHNIESTIFCHKLYELMGWSQEYTYTVHGNHKIVNGEDILYFDLRQAETYIVKSEQPQVSVVKKSGDGEQEQA